MTLQNLGILYWKLDQNKNSIDAYERALTILEKLSATNPQAYEIHLCQTMLPLSMLYESMFKLDPQSEYKNKGLALAERAMSILSKYPNIPRAQNYLKDANDLKAFFEQAGK